MAGGLSFLDPMLMLRARAGDPTAPAVPGASEAPPGPVASPPTAPPLSVPPAAPAGNGPPAAGGGAGLGINGIGSAISRAISGEGLFGSASPEDQEIDPVTGAPRGLARRANMQSLMKVGLLLMAAGQPQSADSRARILSGVAGATDDATNQINAFARNRLEMAKTKLLERQTLQDQAAQTALMTAFGGGGAGAPVASAAPGTVAPPAPIVPAPAVGGGGDPALPATPTPATAQTPAVGTVPGDPASIPAPGATEAALPGREQTPSDVAQRPSPLSTTVPKPPPLPPFQLTPDDLKIVNATPMAQRAGLIEEMRRRHEQQERTSPHYYKPGVGTVFDVYKGDSVVDTRKLSEAPVHVRTVPGELPGTIRHETVDDRGNIIKVDTVRDVRADKVHDMVITSAAKEGEDLRKQYKEIAEPATRAYDKLFDMQKTVMAGGSFTGPLARVKTQALRWISEFAVLKPEDIDALVTSGKINSELGQEAGKFAKENYGPQVSDQDRKNAQELLGAIQTGTKEEIAGAIARLRDGHRQKVEGFNRHRDEYYGRAKSLKDFNADFYTPPKIDKTFDDEAEAAIQPGAPAPGAFSAPAQDIPAAIDAGRRAIEASRNIPGKDPAAVRQAVIERLRKAGVPEDQLGGL